jgi:hypothetical protein
MLATDIQASETLPVDAFRPQWEVGSQWFAETTTLWSPFADHTESKKPIHWQFDVVALERRAGKECWHLVIRPMLAVDRPRTDLWIDAETLSITEIRAEIPVPGGYGSMSEKYKISSGGAPVVSPFSSLPLLYRNL